jgi:hypothetical protein
VRHVEAGPGTGKTRTIVTRFRQQVSTDYGVALLSFTNAAVNVARTRCLDAPHLLESPNFVGTFDSFFHRYVVTPTVVRATAVVPRYLSSWDDLPDHLGIVRLSPGSGIRLSRWVRDADGEIRLSEGQLSRAERQFLGALSAGVSDRIRDAGQARIQGLLKSRIYSADEARRVALESLSSPNLDLQKKLALRFGEVIVDEFQDCDELEHELLASLRTAGIRVVTVADPDQAIYEFRRVDPESYRRHVAALEQRELATLETSYRSTPAICQLVTSLRAASERDVVSNLAAEIPCPKVQVVVGGGINAGVTAARLVRSVGIDARETKIIAHRKQDARKLARAGNQPPASVATINTILTAILDIRGGADARTRHAAVTRLEHAILQLIEWGTDGAPPTRSEQLEDLRITGDQLRILVSRIVTASRDWNDAGRCATQIRSIIKDGTSTFSRQTISTLGNRLAKPNNAIWGFWVSRTQGLTVEAVEAVRWSHVHAVKGDEFDAVIYALPERAVAARHVLDDWEDGINTEARRVLYVGVSRARSFAALVVPKSRRDQLQRILDRDGVSYDVTVVD